MDKGHSTQWLVNTFPLWSDIRNDEQSAGFQFLNPVGLWLDDLRRQTDRINSNYYLPTSIVSDIDVYYKFKLPKSYELSMDEDNTEYLIVAPTVSGLIDTTYYPVTLADDNDIEGFWYDAIPSRLSLEDTVEEVIGSHLVCSGFISQSPFVPLVPSGVITIPNRLTVTISGATSCIDLTENISSVGLVQIDGVTRAGEYITEDLTFVHDDTTTTMNEFAEVSGVRVYGIVDADEAWLTITSSRQGNRSIGEDMYHRSAYELGVNWANNALPLFWSLGQGPSLGAQKTLELHQYEGDDPEIRLDGWVTRSLLSRFELLDTNGDHITPVDMIVEPWSDKIWVAASGILYLFDDTIPYPDTSRLTKRHYDASAVIEPSAYTLVSGETVDLDYIWRRPSIGMLAHRTWVEYPDGTKYSIEDGTETSYYTDLGSWILGEPLYRKIKATESFRLDQRGDYVYSLETKYTDSSTSIDQRIVSVLYKEPRAEFALQDVIGAQNQVRAVDIDSEGKLWVFDQNNQRHQLGLHYDLMLIDVDKKILYFREPYDEVRIFGSD